MAYNVFSGTLNPTQSINFVHLFMLSILCVFWFSLDHYFLILFALVVLGLVSLVLHQEIGWGEPLWNDHFVLHGT